VQRHLTNLARAVTAGAAAALALAIAAPAGAATRSGAAPTRSGAATTTRFDRVDLISDQPGKAPLVDPDLVNAWGLALGPTTPLWVANNGTNTATVYAGGVAGATPTKAPLTVAIPGGAPTGQVYNGTGGFVVRTPDGKGGPARFIFASEGGDITGWSPATSTPTTAILARHVKGAVYKGLALIQAGGHAFLLAADFADNRVDVFDDHFHRLPGASAALRDRTLPAGYAPFDVLVSGYSVFVSYAKQQAGSDDEQHGPGLGFVDEYRWGGGPRRIASHGPLNAPWGLAVAPAGFGAFAGDLLVGNFGDGRVNVYHGARFVGQLRDRRGNVISIPGLWALLPGTVTSGGAGNLWFSAGPDDEAHGLVGELLPARY